MSSLEKTNEKTVTSNTVSDSITKSSNNEFSNPVAIQNSSAISVVSTTCASNSAGCSHYLSPILNSQQSFLRPVITAQPPLYSPLLSSQQHYVMAPHASPSGSCFASFSDTLRSGLGDLIGSISDGTLNETNYLNKQGNTQLNKSCEFSETKSLQQSCSRKSSNNTACSTVVTNCSDTSRNTQSLDTRMIDEFSRIGPFLDDFGLRGWDSCLSNTHSSKNVIHTNAHSYSCLYNENRVDTSWGKCFQGASSNHADSFQDVSLDSLHIKSRPTTHSSNINSLPTQSEIHSSRPVLEYQPLSTNQMPSFLSYFTPLNYQQSQESRSDCRMQQNHLTPTETTELIHPSSESRAVEARLDNKIPRHSSQSKHRETHNNTKQGQVCVPTHNQMHLQPCRTNKKCTDQSSSTSLFCLVCGTAITATQMSDDLATYNINSLVTVVTKVKVFEKINFLMGSNISMDDLPSQYLCPKCFHLINEIDLLEHRLHHCRTFLCSQLEATCERNGIRIDFRRLHVGSQSTFDLPSENHLQGQQSLKAKPHSYLQETQSHGFVPHNSVDSNTQHSLHPHSFSNSVPPAQNIVQQNQHDPQYMSSHNTQNQHLQPLLYQQDDYNSYYYFPLIHGNVHQQENSSFHMPLSYSQNMSNYGVNDEMNHNVSSHRQDLTHNSQMCKTVSNYIPKSVTSKAQQTIALKANYSEFEKKNVSQTSSDNCVSERNNVNTHEIITSENIVCSNSNDGQVIIDNNVSKECDTNAEVTQLLVSPNENSKSETMSTAQSIDCTSLNSKAVSQSAIEAATSESVEDPPLSVAASDMQPPSPSPPSPHENLRNVQDATEYHKPTLLGKNIKTKRHAKLQICRQCDQVFSNRQGLVKHIERRHKSFMHNYICDVCSKKFNSEKILARHIKNHKTYACKLCDVIFVKKSKLKKHLEVHSKENLVCKFCNKGCGSVQALIAHVKTHTTEKKIHKCDICLKKFANSRNLKIHLRNHSGDRPFTCSNCGKGYTHKSNMVVHYNSCIAKTCSDKLRPNNSRSTFSKTSNLQKSVRTKRSSEVCMNAAKKMQVHCRNKSNAVCPVCGKTLSRQELLSDHLNHHTGLRAHSCSQCSASFYYRSNLTHHVRSIHRQLRPYSCNLCGRTFASNHSQKMHLRIHTKEKPFSCKTCGKAFSTKSNYTRHLKCHVIQPSLPSE